MPAPVPSLSAHERAQALEDALAARRRRAEVRRDLKERRIGLSEVLDAAATDEVVARMRVTALLEALPGVGPATAVAVMQELGIAASRRVRGLGPHQRTALLKRFTRA